MVNSAVHTRTGDHRESQHQIGLCSFDMQVGTDGFTKSDRITTHSPVYVYRIPVATGRASIINRATPDETVNVRNNMRVRVTNRDNGRVVISVDFAAVPVPRDPDVPISIYETSQPRCISFRKRERMKGRMVISLALRGAETTFCCEGRLYGIRCSTMDTGFEGRHD